MGAEQSSSISFDRVPDPILTFGKASSSPLLEKFKTVIGSADGMLEKVKAGFKLCATTVPYLDPLAGVVAGINTLLKQQEEFQMSIDDENYKQCRIDLEGKFSAIQRHLRLLNDTKTSDEQRVSELTGALSDFEEILPRFNSTDSSLFKRCHLGAPLFVPLCGMFKIVRDIAQKTSSYNADMEDMTRDYMKTLDRYKLETIRARLTSIHFVQRPEFPLGLIREREHYENELEREFPTYFKGIYFTDLVESRGSNWDNQSLRTYSLSLMHEGTHKIKDVVPDGDDVNCGRAGKLSTKVPFFGESLPMLVDPWDPREESQIRFEKVTLYRSELPPPPEPGYGLSENALLRKAIREYRKMVLRQMESYFESVRIPGYESKAE